jgi:transcriptional regulator with PAS, ATPase and Fis domain
MTVESPSTVSVSHSLPMKWTRHPDPRLSIKQDAFSWLDPCFPQPPDVWNRPHVGWLVTKRLSRADLFYRLNVIPICLLPLHESAFRTPGTEFFVEKFAARLNKPIELIPDEVMAVLKGHDWPGNIRELQNFIERAVLFSPGSVLRLPLDLKQTVKQNSESASRTLADADREHILETFKQTVWLIGGQDGAANRLGLPRSTLISKMPKLGIEVRRSTKARPIRQYEQ